MDWNDPDELRRLRDLLAADPAQVATIEGPDGPVTDTVEMLVGRLGMQDVGGSLLHVQQREQRPDLGLPRGVPPARLDLQGPRHDAVVRALRDGPVADRDERGLPDREDPGLTVRFPLVDRPGEALLVWTTTPWTLDRERRGRGRAGSASTSGSGRATTSSGSGRGPSSRRCAGPFEVVE